MIIRRNKNDSATAEVNDLQVRRIKVCRGIEISSADYYGRPPCAIINFKLAKDSKENDDRKCFVKKIYGKRN